MPVSPSLQAAWVGAAVELTVRLALVDAVLLRVAVLLVVVADACAEAARLHAEDLDVERRLERPEVDHEAKNLRFRRKYRGKVGKNLPKICKNLQKSRAEE